MDREMIMGALEQLSNSNLRLCFLKKEPTSLRAGEMNGFVVIGPADEKRLSFAIDNTHHGKMRYMYNLMQLIPLDPPGSNLVSFYDDKGNSGNFMYIIHQTQESMPKDVQYEELSFVQG